MDSLPPVHLAMIEPGTIAILAAYCGIAIVRHFKDQRDRRRRATMDAFRDAEIKQLKARAEAIESAIRNTPFGNHN